MESQLTRTSSPTIAAEGEKPAFYGSEENGTGSEKWELFYSDEEGKKIWKFHREMTEVASIVLNEKEFVLRDVAYWNGKSYLQMEDDHQFSTNKIYDVISYFYNIQIMFNHKYSVTIFNDSIQYFK